MMKRKLCWNIQKKTNFKYEFINYDIKMKKKEYRKQVFLS